MAFHRHMVVVIVCTVLNTLQCLLSVCPLLWAVVGGRSLSPDWLNSLFQWSCVPQCSRVSLPRLTPSWGPRGQQQGPWTRLWCAPRSTWWRRRTSCACASRATWPPPRERWGCSAVCMCDRSVLPRHPFLIIFFYFLRKVQKSLPRSLLTVPSTWQRATHPGSTPPCPSCAGTSRCCCPPLPSSCLQLFGGSAVESL